LVSDGAPDSPKRATIDKVMAHYSKTSDVGSYICNICADNGKTKAVAGKKL
jgi:hypothetical protein